MKTKLSLISFLGGLLLFSQAAMAQTTTFTTSATVPSASSVSVTVDSINSSTNAFTQEPSGFTALSFDPMTFNTTNNVYVPDHYFAVNFSVGGGSGRPDVSFTYNEGANPNSGNSSNPNGLGHKSSAAFFQESSSGETALSAHPKKMLINLSSEHVAFTELTQGSFLRVYLGVCTGGTSDPTGCAPFTNSDASGQYTGSLVATAVVN